MAKRLCCFTVLMALVAAGGCSSSSSDGGGKATTPADKAMKDWFDLSVALQKAEQSGDQAKVAKLEQDLVPVALRVTKELEKLPVDEREALIDRWAKKFEGAGFAPPGTFNQ